MKYFTLRIRSSFLFIFAVLGALFSIAVVAQTAPSTQAPASQTPTTNAGAAEPERYSKPAIRNDHPNSGFEGDSATFLENEQEGVGAVVTTAAPR